MRSNMERSIQYMQEKGYVCGPDTIVERRVGAPGFTITRDLLNCIDFLALDLHTAHVVGVQTTSSGCFKDHLNSYNGHLGLLQWLQAGGTFVVHGWKKVKNRWVMHRSALAVGRGQPISTVVWVEEKYEPINLVKKYGGSGMKQSPYDLTSHGGLAKLAQKQRQPASSCTREGAGWAERKAMETAWLVERHDRNHIEYLYFDETGAGIEWTGDAYQACRFSRRVDAESAAAGGEFMDLRVAEHEFDPNAALTGGEAVPSDARLGKP